MLGRLNGCNTSLWCILFLHSCVYVCNWYLFLLAQREQPHSRSWPLPRETNSGIFPSSAWRPISRYWDKLEPQQIRPSSKGWFSSWIQMKQVQLRSSLVKSNNIIWSYFSVWRLIKLLPSLEKISLSTVCYFKLLEICKTPKSPPR